VTGGLLRVNTGNPHDKRKDMTMKAVIRMTIGILLGGALTACGDGGGTDTAQLTRVAQAVARQEQRVDAAELANWIIEGRKDFMLVDIRPPEAYADAHIEGAVNVPITELVTADYLGNIPDDRRIIVYSRGSENAAAAATLLRVAGYDAALLAGGYNSWNQQVLNPDIPDSATADETPQTARQRAIACYFIGDGSAPPPVVAKEAKPAFVPPVATPAKAAPPAGLMMEEGC
jgi:hypothetical protein